MNKSLFQITEEQSYLLQIIEENEGELTPELEEALTLNQMGLEVKAESYIHVIKRLQADVQLAKDYEATAKAFRAKKEKAIERLEQALLNAVLRFDKIETGIHTVSTRKSESVEITDEQKLSTEYTTVKLVVTPNKTLIKSAIKAGKEVPGAVLKVNDNLSIK